MNTSLPNVIADGPLAEAVSSLLENQVNLHPWDLLETGTDLPIDAVYTYGHNILDGEHMDRVPSIKVISNYGVGVDHINLEDAKQREIPVGNTPGILDGATADMGFCLLLAVARRLVEGQTYATGPDFLQYDPGYMLGLEVHSQKLGIIGMGRIGTQVAKRALGFDMEVTYHNRNRKPETEADLGVTYQPLDELIQTSDFIMLTCPLTKETTGLIDLEKMKQMKSSAIIVNIARGPVIVSDDLVTALKTNEIASAGLDVTDPEPLPRGHALLELPNCTIVPHLGSATVQTRQKMAEMSVENLLAGLAGKPLPYRVA